MMVMLVQADYVKDGLPGLICVLEELMNWEKHATGMVNFHRFCLLSIRINCL